MQILNCVRMYMRGQSKRFPPDGKKKHWPFLGRDPLPTLGWAGRVCATGNTPRLAAAPSPLPSHIAVQFIGDPATESIWQSRLAFLSSECHADVAYLEKRQCDITCRMETPRKKQISLLKVTRQKVTQKSMEPSLKLVFLSLSAPCFRSSHPKYLGSTW